MKKAELLLASIAIIGIIFNLLHYPGGSVILIISLSLLSLFYFYLSFAFFNGLGFRNMFKRKSYREISQMRILGAVATGAILSVAFMGILFKTQMYPGAEMQLTIGVFGLVIVLAISLFKNLKSSDEFYSRIIKRVVIVGSVTLFLFLVSDSQWLNWSYPNNPEYVEAILKAQADPQNEALWEEVNVKWEEMEKRRLEKLNEGFEEDAE